MLKSIEGIYRDGKIELLERPPANAQGKVIVTFLESGASDLSARGSDESQAADLRHRLQTIAEEWNLPEMDAVV